MENIKLLEIKGYYNKVNMFEFSEEQSWNGHVILREDLTFEGIVVDEYSNVTTENRLIYGTLVDYNGASLMKFSKINICPCSFFGMSNGKEIFGTWAIHNYYSARDMGRCKIVFKEIPLVEEMVQSIESKIDMFKEEMDDYAIWLYLSFIEKMPITVQEFLKNLEECKKEVEAELGFSIKKLEL